MNKLIIDLLNITYLRDINLRGVNELTKRESKTLFDMSQNKR